MGTVCPSIRLSVRPYVHKQSSRYLHEILWKCLLGQDKVSNTKCLVSELCPFENRNSVTVVYIFMKLYSNVYDSQNELSSPIAANFCPTIFFA